MTRHNKSVLLLIIFNSLFELSLGYLSAPYNVPRKNSRLSMNVVRRNKPGKIVVKKDSDRVKAEILLDPPKLITFEAEGTLMQLSTPMGLQLREALLKANRYTVRLPGPTAFENEYLSVFNNAMEEEPIYGFKDEEPSFNWWYNVIQLSLKKTLLNYGIPPEEVLEPIFEELFDEFYFETCTGLESWELRPDVLETLDRLADWRDETGANLGVISNSDERLSTILDNLDILDHFDFVFTSREMGSELPSTAMFDEAIKRCGILPSEAWHCGNNLERSVMASKEAGWKPVFINKPPYKKGPQIVNCMSISKLLPALRLPPIPGPIRSTRRRGQFVEEYE